MTLRKLYTAQNNSYKMCKIFKNLCKRIQWSPRTVRGLKQRESIFLCWRRSMDKKPHYYKTRLFVLHFIHKKLQHGCFLGSIVYLLRAAKCSCRDILENIKRQTPQKMGRCWTPAVKMPHRLAWVTQPTNEAMMLKTIDYVVHCPKGNSSQ